MPEIELTERKFKQQKRVARYKAGLSRRRMPSNRREKAVADYAAGLELEDKLAAVCSDVMARHGSARPAWRLAFRTMARKLVGISRKEPVTCWPEMMAEAGAARVARGIDAGIVLESLLACNELFGSGAEPESIKVAFEKSVAARAVEKPPEPEATPPVVGSGAEHSISPDLAAELKKKSSLEAVREKRAAEALKAAVFMLKPWARTVVVGRIADRKSYAQLAKDNALRKKDVVDILKQARAFVRKYTTYFDDDWFWTDVPAGQGA